MNYLGLRFIHGVVVLYVNHFELQSELWLSQR